MYRPISRALCWAALAALACAAPGAAQPPGSPQTVTPPNPYYQMGHGICLKMLTGGFGAAFDSAQYIARVRDGHLETEAFCHCTGEIFADDPDDRFGVRTATGDQAAVAMTAKINFALETCNSMDGDLVDTDLATDPYDSDAQLPDYAPADPALALDDGDAEMCRMFVDDRTLIPGFTAETVVNRITRTGQPVDDLCGCAGRKMTAKAKQLERELKDAPNPSVIYSSTLGGAIHSCLK